MITTVFVYGTLKTGQCREKCWPCEPSQVTKAWTYGELYDTGPYPALFPGKDRVAGELWTFPGAAMPTVLAELDLVEEYTPGDEATNLYNRCEITCFDQAGNDVRAYTYLYGRQLEKQFFSRVQPDYSWGDLRLALWPPETDW
jgi:gamma-glutamylcyclotransferase (GGCT)/AIG2-like uncharacterized protein YtfP